MKINFVNELDTNTKEYEKIIKRVFRKIKSKMFFNIIFVSEDKIQQINNDYRGINKVTDVITFALMENQDEIFKGAERELGDVLICVDKGIAQALEYGHSVEREIGFLAVHGYLHLIGYDHNTPQEEKEMFALQEEILKKAKLERK